MSLAGMMRDCAKHSDIEMYNKINRLMLTLLVATLGACGQDAEPVAGPAADMMSAGTPGSLDQGLSLINSDAIEAHLGEAQISITTVTFLRDERTVGHNTAEA